MKYLCIIQPSLDLLSTEKISGNFLSMETSRFVLDKQYRRKKAIHIYKILNAEMLDIEELRQFCLSPGGLVTNELRRLCWPCLLHSQILAEPANYVCQEKSKYYEQVVMDVKRSLKRFPPGMSDTQREKLQEQMVDIIMLTLARHPKLHYYQGFHDICVTFLLVIGENLTSVIIDKLVTMHLRDFMDETMEKTNEMLSCIYPIIGAECPNLRYYMERAELGTIFCLPWLITWFAHTLGDFRKVVRLYDVFLAMHPLFPVYVGAAIVLYRKNEIFETNCDMPSLHSLLSKIPQNLPLDQIIRNAKILAMTITPEEVIKEVKLQRSAEFLYGRSRHLTISRRGGVWDALWSLFSPMHGAGGRHGTGRGADARPQRHYELTPELRRRHGQYSAALTVVGTSLAVVCLAVFVDWRSLATTLASRACEYQVALPDGWHFDLFPRSSTE